jgi:hypothetical protein
MAQPHDAWACTLSAAAAQVMKRDGVKLSKKEIEKALTGQHSPFGER